MVRIDMSEFMEKHSVSRLIGAPPGYVGYEEGGYLTEAVRRRPYSIILLDEIEKAHRDVFNILLQVLDDGRLTDGQGRTVDFKNTVIVMTSNLGSEVIQDLKGEAYGDMKQAVMEVVSRHFRPEFLNRIDEAVVFHALLPEDIERIATLHIAVLKKRLLIQGYDVSIAPEAIAFLSKQGYDVVYGARPLKRVFQKYLENPLAQKILQGDLRKGRSIAVGLDNEELIIT